jgi:thiamine biosynthesis protein ThiS
LTIVVNGNQTDIPDSSTISDLITQLGLNPERVAVERNRKIVRRAEWDSTAISEGDRFEVVHFVGGGSKM